MLESLQVASSHNASFMVELPPLVVDLDGTLVMTDTLFESVLLLFKSRPLDLFRLPFWLFQGRAFLKHQVAQRVTLDIASLPWNAALVEFVRASHKQGRKTILATAADQSIAQAVAEHLNVFDQVIASNASVNLKGHRKLDAIRSAVGETFVYTGDSAADLPIWRGSAAAIVVGASPRITKIVRNAVPIEREFPAVAPDMRSWLQALRVHQWAKNLLLLVPMLTAFSTLEIGDLFSMLGAFLAFSMTASATYLGNDMLDLQSDRVHPRKCKRMLASGRISIAAGLGMAAGLLVAGVLLAAAVSPLLLLILLCYLVLTVSYSLTLKRYVLLDVLTLAALYTLRIMAGAVTIGVTVSSWLLAFSMFVFLSLALVKRCAELVALAPLGRPATSGRDYRVTDLVVLWPLGLGASMSAVVVFGLFINSAETLARYPTPHLLWLSAAGLVYWLSRLWIKTARGEMHDDPVVYAVKDRGSLITIVLMLAATAAARLFDWSI